MSRIFHFGSPLARLGPLERRVLEAIWERRSATVRELIEGGHQDLAYTTVMTTLDRLFKKNLLTREAEGRAFRYAPRLTREELYRQAAGEAFRHFLNASSQAMLPLSHLVEIVTERDAQLLDDLSSLVEAKRRELKNVGAGESRDRKSRDKEKA